MVFQFEPLRYNSREVSFGEWVSLLTLCLAPLVAHVFAGSPTPSYLVSSRPRWYDRLCVFNPTAILYRYGAIADRRIRVYRWEGIDVAAANALFWTGHGWDGSEEMVMDTLPYCTLPPESTTVRILSIDMLKTVITTVQGLQVVEDVIGNRRANGYIAVDYIFGPLSVLGLLRVFASPWLVGDFSYSAIAVGKVDTSASALQTSPPARYSTDSLLQTRIDLPERGRYRPTTYWPSRIFRFLYLAIIVCIWAMTGAATFFINGSSTTILPLHVTSLVLNIFYFILATFTMACYAFYFFHGHTTSTILPCISKPWFKAYSIYCALSMAVMVVIAAIETNRTVCGDYVSTPLTIGYHDCISAESLVLVDPDPVGSLEAFGLATQNGGAQNITGDDLNDIGTWVVNFTGYCLGHFVDPPMRMPETALGLTNDSSAAGRKDRR